MQELSGDSLRAEHRVLNSNAQLMQPLKRILWGSRCGHPIFELHKLTLGRSFEICATGLTTSTSSLILGPSGSHSNTVHPGTVW